jgi:hypothetical protein
MMFGQKAAWLLMALTLLVGCSMAERSAEEGNGSEVSGKPSPEVLDLPDLGSAPELANEVWLNTAEPLHLQDLGGKVVLLEFWTFG